jgi:hypothetical protein
VVGEAREALL